MPEISPHSVAVSTAAIISGFGCKGTLHQAYQETIEAMDSAYGHAEIFSAIAENAVHSCELAHDLATELSWLQHPGVRAYDVDEPFGVWLYEYCQQHKCMPAGDVAIKKFGELALAFHSKELSQSQHAELTRYLGLRTQFYETA